ncbi:MAG: transrane cytochrome oxidase, partial [Rhizobacter sp.]|nr:transrane cytochrome oxidase [Rhizobacter sp.]
GWAPRDLLDRTRVPDVATPAGLVELVGRIAPAPGRLYDFNGAASGTIRQNLDPMKFGDELKVAMRPWSLLQDEPERVLTDAVTAPSTASPSSTTPSGDARGVVVADGLLRQWALPALDVQKHYGYAFQWFAMCALITGLYVWFQLVRPSLRNRRPLDALA